MPSGSYSALHQRLSRTIPPSRLFDDELRTLAYGTDASFYRLIPRLVVKVECEAEVVAIAREARGLGIPLTFRAAGTSLSGQSVTDAVLVVTGSSWRGYRIKDDAALISLDPGVIGGHANAFLAPYGRKIGPDPASINAAMIGGIAANNASGMCCGTAQNSYHTLASMRVVFADGSVLDTADPASREAFEGTHASLLGRLAILADRVKANGPLAERIRRKFRMKNTTGYSLNALVDFDDPIEILQHLMIGSEGTLGFIAEITYRTVPEFPWKASSLILFPTIASACAAVATLKSCPVDAVELMDRASLRSVEAKEGMPSSLRGLASDVAALLVETRAPSSDTLRDQISRVSTALQGHPTVQPLEFTDIPAEYGTLWNIRKGLFPSVGAMRERGTTVIIEDVAFPVPRLAEATLDLQSLFRKHGYDEAIIFGHALEGNLHFVFTQDFNTQAEVNRYAAFIDDLARMVVGTYDGSLKAEHGTGRNMAPYVELEWGAEAYAIMKEIKAIFDPGDLLNPGVVLNADPAIHLKNLKPLPAADAIVDTCIECGFCEVHCPSRDLTLTPRQRIVAFREIARLRSQGEDVVRRNALARAYRYFGEQTCATDGLCATACPVGIDTGTLIKQLREQEAGPIAVRIANLLAENMGSVTAVMRRTLNAVDRMHWLLGTGGMETVTTLAHAVSFGAIPRWNPHMPKGADRLPADSSAEGRVRRVVYFPTCINRTMGVPAADRGLPSLTTVTVNLLRKAGYRVVFPEHLDNLCCGMAFASKGFRQQGEHKAEELHHALLKASRDGEDPILVDMSPCLYRMKESFPSGLKLEEPVAFVEKYLLERLTIRKRPITVAVHTTCSAEKMGLAADLRKLAERCAERVIVPEGIGCCGWAGDRGFTFPELNASALRTLGRSLPAGCVAGYSTSRTCEIGLSLHGGIPYRSILYLVDECSSAL